MTANEFYSLFKTIRRSPNQHRATINARNWFKRNHVPTVPFGDGDSKTGSPGTYRPVGRSCPSDCPYLGRGCYAEVGNVALHQCRSTIDRESAVNSAAACMAIASIHGQRARLHVSGDFGANGQIDREYVRRLAQMAQLVRAETGRWGLAWTYTHFPPADFEPYRLALQARGITVVYSDHAEPGGAVVWHHNDVDTLRANNPGVKFGKCPAQLSKNMDCAKCGLCWKARGLGLCIVFDPHGTSSKQAAKQAVRVQRATVSAAA